MDPAEWCHVLSLYHVIKLKTCTMHHSVGSMFEINFQMGQNFFRSSNFKTRFEISNKFLRHRSFGHYAHFIPYIHFFVNSLLTDPGDRRCANLYLIFIFLSIHYWQTLRTGVQMACQKHWKSKCNLTVPTLPNIEAKQIDM